MTSAGEGLKPWIADALTLSNGVFGFLSILTWTGELGPLSGIPNKYVAAAYIGLGLVADGVDGIVARAWGSTGLGEALDSINDALTFSVAPAVFLIGVYAGAGNLAFRVVLYLVALGFVLAGMLRLARHQNGEKADAFEGLPTPWSAAALIAVLLVEPSPWVALVLALILAGLNLSRVPYPKTRGLRMRRAALVLVVATLAVITALLVFSVVSSPPVLVVWLAIGIALALILLAPLAVP